MDNKSKNTVLPKSSKISTGIKNTVLPKSSKISTGIKKTILPKSSKISTGIKKTIAAKKPFVSTLIKIKKNALIKSSNLKDKIIENFLKKARKQLLEEFYTELDKEIIIAVSGGVDSVVLLDVIANLATELSLRNIYIAHYNHKLRGKASLDDQEFVKTLAEKYGLGFHYSTGNVKQHALQQGLSIETAARTMRYKYFERVSKQLKCKLLATAHNANDCIETFFINLLRGSGLTGLSGIPSNRVLLKNVNLIRPLLNFTKDEIIEYAKVRKLTWHEDETNSLLYFTRNKIRHDLIPKLEKEYNPAIKEIILRTQKLISGADAYLAREVNNLLPTLIKSRSINRFALDIPLLATYEDFIQGEVIQTAISSFFQIQGLSLATIDRIKQLIDSPVSNICDINKRLYAVRDRNSIVISRKQALQKTSMAISRSGSLNLNNIVITLKEVNRADVQFSNNPKIEYIDMDLVPANMFVRNWEIGDEFNPIGMTGTMKVSDFLTNIKVPILDKPDVLLLSTRTDIIWVIGKRLSNKYKVTDKTEHVLKAVVEYREKNNGNR